SRCIGEFSFRSEVRAGTLRWGRVVVVLENKIYVYSFMDLNLLHQIEAHLRGLCWLAFSQSKHRICVSLPGASSRPGSN
ncbi:hypothetical protein OIU85_004022, partial [Salix viminalis]